MGNLHLSVSFNNLLMFMWNESVVLEVKYNDMDEMLIWSDIQIQMLAIVVDTF